MGLLLFLDLLPLFPVDGVSATDMPVGAGLNHFRQSPEQAEDSGGGLPVDMVLNLFQQSGGLRLPAVRQIQPVPAYEGAEDGVEPVLFQKGVQLLL